MQLLIQLLSENTVYAIENPGYEKLNLLFKSNRVHYVSLPLDEHGIEVASLQASDADVLSITPSHQFPTGRIMPVTRRLQLLQWANEKSGRYILEDDYDSEFRYGGKPIPSLQGLDGQGKVIYLGAFSKSLSPALRISYMVLPEVLMEHYESDLSFYFCPVPLIEQKILHTFIERGHFERHLNRMRNLYRQKREILVTSYLIIATLRRNYRRFSRIASLTSHSQWHERGGTHTSCKPSSGAGIRTFPVLFTASREKRHCINSAWICYSGNG